MKWYLALPPARLTSNAIARHPLPFASPVVVALCALLRARLRSSRLFLVPMFLLLLSGYTSSPRGPVQHSAEGVRQTSCEASKDWFTSQREGIRGLPSLEQQPLGEPTTLHTPSPLLLRRYQNPFLRSGCRHPLCCLYPRKSTPTARVLVRMLNSVARAWCLFLLFHRSTPPPPSSCQSSSSSTLVANRHIGRCDRLSHSQYRISLHHAASPTHTKLFSLHPTYRRVCSKSYKSSRHVFLRRVAAPCLIEK